MGKRDAVLAAWYGREVAAVVPLCEEFGFGRVMQIAADEWAKRDPVGALTVGPCRATDTPTPARSAAAGGEGLTEERIRHAIMYDPMAHAAYTLGTTKGRESADRELASLRQQLAAAEERARTVLDAKSHWADRARNAEQQLAAAREDASTPIRVKPSPTADTRTCDYTNVSKETLYASSEQHIEDVRKALRFFAARLATAGENHDPDKLTDIDGFHADFVTGFAQTGWWDRHRMLNRHHLTMEDGIPIDVNLIDVLDFIADCVMAGMARSGSVYPLELPSELLERAFQNTVELLKAHVTVDDRARTEPAREGATHAEIIDALGPMVDGGSTTIEQVEQATADYLRSREGEGGPELFPFVPHPSTSGEQCEYLTGYSGAHQTTCGVRATYRYEADGGSYMHLCDKHGARHADYAERWENGAWQPAIDRLREGGNG